MTQRVALSKDLNEFKKSLIKYLDILEKDKSWYVSIYLERKKKTSFGVDFKKSDINTTSSIGIILRIYDGFTLFEEATNQLQDLEKTATSLVNRVKNTKKDQIKRPYSPPSWKERLKEKLDDEIKAKFQKMLMIIHGCILE